PLHAAGKRLDVVAFDQRVQVVALHGKVRHPKAVLLVAPAERFPHLAEELLSTKPGYALCGVPHRMIGRGALVPGAPMMADAVPGRPPRAGARTAVSDRRKLELDAFLH